MANVYIEPKPTGRAEHDPIDHYVVEHANGARKAAHIKRRQMQFRLQSVRAITLSSLASVSPTREILTTGAQQLEAGSASLYPAERKCDPARRLSNHASSLRDVSKGRRLMQQLSSPSVIASNSSSIFGSSLWFNPGLATRLS